MKNYTVYQITNKVNGMIYVGVHVTGEPNDFYLGSGTNIIKAIKILIFHQFSLNK